MKPFLYLFTAALTVALAFLWACARLADRRPIMDTQALSSVGSGPYTAFAKRPLTGTGPYYSVTPAQDDSPNECGARLDIRWVAPGVFRTGVDHPDRYGPVPPGLRSRHLRPLPGYQEVYALAAIHHGQAAVGYCKFAGSGAWLQIKARALLWQQGRVRALGTLPGYQITHAVALSDGGLIVGDATIDSFPTSMDDPAHAVCRVGGKVRDLGTGWALAVNNVGQIVGDSGTGPADYFHDAHALLWTHGYRYDLNDSIPKHSGWLLVQATRIDSHGRIAGCGTFHGSAHAFLLTPRRFQAALVGARPARQPSR